VLVLYQNFCTIVLHLFFGLSDVVRAC
jgi:hypothetical protein